MVIVAGCDVKSSVYQFIPSICWLKWDFEGGKETFLLKYEWWTWLTQFFDHVSQPKKCWIPEEHNQQSIIVGEVWNDALKYSGVTDFSAEVTKSASLLRHRGLNVKKSTQTNLLFNCTLWTIKCFIHPY